MGVLQYLDANPGTFDISSIHSMYVGGSAVPQSLIEAFQRRYGMKIYQAWGMTEMSPLGTVAHVPASIGEEPSDEMFRNRAKQGRPVPFVELRARGDDGIVAWDGKSMGELEVRGPWIASAYYNRDDCADRFTEDGWFKTGDIVTIEEDGTIQVQDRSKDLIKSGGEWISSIAIENIAAAYPKTALAAVIGRPHPKWGERPLLLVRLKDGETATAAEMLSFLESRVAKWWIPDEVLFVDRIPLGPTGKIDKKALRAAHGGSGAVPGA
jgi:fatty-acyl-CoA synthase